MNPVKALVKINGDKNYEEESQEDKDYQQGVEDGKNGKDFDIFTATPDYALGHEVGSTQRKKYGDFDKERFELE